MHPWIFRRYTPAEFLRRCRAHAARQARRADARAWTVAHLMIATGNMGQMTVSALMRDLLGREPGTVDAAAPPAEDAAHMTPEASVAYLASVVRAFGGKDRR